MSDTHSPVSHATLTHVLDTLESRGPTALRELSEGMEISPSTAARAVGRLTESGILTLSEGRDPQSGRIRRVASPAPAAVLSVLSLRRGKGYIRALDCGLNHLGTAITELNPAVPPEENLRLLCRRGMTLLRGCAGASGLPVAAPVLLVEEETPNRGALTEAVADAMGVAPLAVISDQEAIARGLRREALPQSVASLLFLRVGEGDRTALLLRAGGGWVASPLGRGLTATLGQYLPSAGSSCEAVRRGAVGFLADLCRFLTPDLVMMEDARGCLPDAEVVGGLLPHGVEVRLRIADADTLSMAEVGAALLGRRMLWDSLIAAEKARRK